MPSRAETPPGECVEALANCPQALDFLDISVRFDPELIKAQLDHECCELITAGLGSRALDVIFPWPDRFGTRIPTCISKESCVAKAEAGVQTQLSSFQRALFGTTLKHTPRMCTQHNTQHNSHHNSQQNRHTHTTEREREIFCQSSKITHAVDSIDHVHRGCRVRRCLHSTQIPQK